MFFLHMNRSCFTDGIILEPTCDSNINNSRALALKNQVNTIQTASPECVIPGLFEVRVAEYLDSNPEPEPSGVNKFLKGLGEFHAHALRGRSGGWREGEVKGE